MPRTLQKPFVEAPHRLHQKLLSAEVERVARDLGVRFDFEVHALLGHKDVRSIERRKVAICSVHDAATLDEQEAITSGAAQREPVISRILCRNDNQIRQG